LVAAPVPFSAQNSKLFSSEKKGSEERAQREPGAKVLEENGREPARRTPKPFFLKKVSRRFLLAGGQKSQR
tara:strand:- start:353 stop:565 length:213 start_codon:yes stop_codon:yes gene_type:complete